MNKIQTFDLDFLDKTYGKEIFWVENFDFLSCYSKE